MSKRSESLELFRKSAEWFCRPIEPSPMEWINVKDENAQDLLGSSQIDALANLTTTYSSIKRTRIAPVDLITALSVISATLGPMLPLVLTVYTPIEIFEVLKGIVL